MTTRRDIEDQLSEARRRATEARKEESGAKARAEMWEQAAAFLESQVAESLTGDLQAGSLEGTLGTVEAVEVNAGSKVSKAKTKDPWPFAKALHAAGSSPAQWAEAKAGRPGAETVRSWLKRPGKGGRACPRVWADAIEAEFKKTKTPVPARASSWPNGIKET